MTPPSLREGLLCLCSSSGRVVGTLVLRQGLHFSLLLHLLDDEASLAASPPGLEQLSRALELPVRLLDSDEGAFLALKTSLAHREGHDYTLARGG